MATRRSPQRLTRDERRILDEARYAIQRAMRIGKPAARRTLASRLYGALTEALPGERARNPRVDEPEDAA